MPLGPFTLVPPSIVSDSHIINYTTLPVCACLLVAPLLLLVVICVGFWVPMLDFLVDPKAPETQPTPEPNAPDDEYSDE